jgi:L-aspartate semialdehyde sulfurtransferase ferredoxin
MRKYVLKYSADAAKKPILSEAIIKTGVKVNILTADVEFSTETLVVSVIGGATEEKSLISYLSKNGVGVEELKGEILKDEERCVDCCACYGVCPTKAITIKDYRMILNNDECIKCKACIEACPTRALKLKEG